MIEPEPCSRITDAACRRPFQQPFRCTDDLVELILCHVPHRRVACDSGVVDHHVECSEKVDSRGDRSCHFLAVSYVATDGLDRIAPPVLPASLLLQLLHLYLANPVDSRMDMSSMNAEAASINVCPGRRLAIWGRAARNRSACGSLSTSQSKRISSNTAPSSAPITRSTFKHAETLSLADSAISPSPSRRSTTSEALAIPASMCSTGLAPESCPPYRAASSIVNSCPRTATVMPRVAGRASTSNCSRREEITEPPRRNP
jgi:hypothetical protein